MNLTRMVLATFGVAALVALCGLAVDIARSADFRSRWPGDVKRVWVGLEFCVKGSQDNNLPKNILVNWMSYEIVWVCWTHKLSDGFVTNISQSCRIWMDGADGDGPRRNRDRWVGVASPPSPWPLESPIGLFAMETVNSTIPTRLRRNARGSLVLGAVPEKGRS